MYPVEKYKIYVSEKERKVIVVSTYAGRTVKGYAKCDERDEFDVEKGKQLAIARCAEKISRKRFSRAQKKIVEAQHRLEEARKYYEDMSDYYNSAQKEVSLSQIEVKRIESELC